jgi:TonB-dependent starch-binding outer membrane protein SusC
MKNSIQWLIWISILTVGFYNTADAQSASQQDVTDLTYLQKKEIIWNSNPVIQINLQQVSMEEALVAIAKQARAGLYYDADLLPEETVSLESEDKPLSYVLNELLKDTNLEAYASGRNILLREKKPIEFITEIRTDDEIGIQETVRGQVVDAQTGEALPGVNILIQGTSTGTATNIDGEFELQVPSLESVLVVSYIGYQTQEVSIDGRIDLEIELISEALIGEELVVVGYGTQRRQDIISSVSTINTDDLGMVDINTPNAVDLLKGRVAGVRIQESTGAAGSTPIIRVRGITSINAGNEPLVVVDGFPVGNGFPETLNPDDITNISVLKDAAATAIYGARGSSGVVLIETANARVGMSEFSYTNNFSIRQLPNSWRPQMLNAEEAVLYNIERFEALDAFTGATSPTPIPQIYLDGLEALERGELQNHDWFDLFIQEGTSTLGQNHNMTYRTGSENLRMVVSGGYLDQKSVLPSDNFKRLSLRTKFDVDISENLRMGINLEAARTLNNRVPSDGVRSGIWAATATSPLISPYDENGNLMPFIPAPEPRGFSKPNPLFEAQESLDQVINRNLQANIDFDVEILEGLHYTPRVFVRQLTRGVEQFTPTTIGRTVIAGSNLFNGEPPQPNSGLIQNFELENWGIDNLVRYSRSLENHNFNFLIGQSLQKESGFTTQITGNIFPSDQIVNYANAAELNSSNSDFEWSMIAGFGQIKYDYQSRYLVEFNIRREGSSRFGPNNRFGNFPSGALGWRISNESFFPQNLFINELLLKGSLGKTGNSDIGNFEALGQLGSTRTVWGENIIESKFLSTITNEDLTWETAIQWQIGANIGMFNNSINLDVEYYKKTTKDMLFNVAPPGASGFNNVRLNLGEMENRGIDITLSSFQNLGRGLQWNSNLNVSWMSNVVTHMPDQIQRIIVGSRTGTNITMVGEEVGAFYGFIRLGLFDEETANDPNTAVLEVLGEKIPGTNMFKDLTGNGIVNQDDKTVTGSPHPDVILGFNNEFAYRNFSLSILITSMLGYEIYPHIRDVDLNQGGRFNNHKWVLDRWKSPEEPGNGFVPRSEVSGRQNMDDWLEPGDHLWIKNIRFSYSLPAEIVQSLGLNQVRFIFTADNVARFDNYSGMNPEVSSFTSPLRPGIDDYVNPISRAYSLGINLSF